MKRITHLSLLVCLLVGVCISVTSATKPSVVGEEVQRMAALSGRSGGHLVIGQRAEPKTLNPVTATDADFAGSQWTAHGGPDRNQSGHSTDRAGTG